MITWAAIEIMYQIRGGNNVWMKGMTEQEKMTIGKDEDYRMSESPVDRSVEQASGQSTSTPANGNGDLHARH